MRTFAICRHGRRRGAAVIAALLMMMVLGGLSLALVSVVSSGHGEWRSERDALAARCATESAAAESLMSLEQFLDGNLGSADHPVSLHGAQYWVETQDLGGGFLSVVATGVDGSAAARMEMVLLREPAAFFRWAAFGAEGLTMSSNAHMDSYDSRLGTWASQASNGSGSSKWSRDDGNVGSNANVSLSTNAAVRGNATPGPGGSATVTGNAVVTGSTTPAAMELELPPIETPEILSAGSWEVTGLSNVVGPGELAYDALRLDGTSVLRIVGPATVVLDSLYLASNSRLEIDGTDGDVTIYVENDFVMKSNTFVGSTVLDPRHLELNLETDNVINPEVSVDLDEVVLDSNAGLYGTVYAPNALVEIDSNFELYGSLIARSVHLDSNSRIHFDEALLDDGDSSSDVLERVMCRDIGVSRKRLGL